jgi:hypothetical protein
MKISIELDKLENLVLELMEKYKGKEITRDEFTKILEDKGYKSTSIDNDTLYVTSGKILSALFDTIAMLTSENKELKNKISNSKSMILNRFNKTVTDIIRDLGSK